MEKARNKTVRIHCYIVANRKAGLYHRDAQGARRTTDDISRAQEFRTLVNAEEWCYDYEHQMGHKLFPEMAAMPGEWIVLQVLSSGALRKVPGPSAKSIWNANQAKAKKKKAAAVRKRARLIKRAAEHFTAAELQILGLS